MNKRKKIKWMLLLLILGSTVGFAMFNAKLNIGGLARVNSSSFNIHWNPDSIEVTTGSSTASTPAYVSDDEQRLVSFEVGFENPGDYYEFTVDAKNYGALTGSIGNLNVFFYESDGETVITDENMLKCLKYSFTYADGSAIQNGDQLGPRQSIKYRFRIEYDYDNPAPEPIDDIILIIEIKPNDGWIITFDANGGLTEKDGNLVPSATTIIEKGVSLGTLPSAQHEVKAFAGWFTEQNGGTLITTSTVPTGNTTYYAHWNSNIVSISYNSNGGTLISGGPGVTLDANYDVLQNGNLYTTEIDFNDLMGSNGLINYNNSDGIVNLEYPDHFVETGYEWKSNQRTYSQSDVYTASDFCDANEANCRVVLYVNWTDAAEIANPPSYTLTYDSQGGSTCDPGTITKQKGEKWTDYDQGEDYCRTTKAGNVFLGWFDDPTAGNHIYFNVAEAVQDLTVYAHWKPEQTFTLTYDDELHGVDDTEGVCDGKTVTRLEGEVWAPYCNPKVTGCTFKGWYENEEHKYFASEKASENVTVYSKWQTKSKIKYNNAGGTGCTSKTVTHYYGDGEKWGTLCTPTRDGYSFGGWFTETNGNGTHIYSTTAIADSCTVNLNVYANWKPNVCTITFDPNGGTFNNHADTLTQKVNYGSSINDFRNASGGYYNATKAHYHIDVAEAWAGPNQIKKFAQDDVSYAAEDICDNLDKGASSITLKVLWKPDEYTLTYNNNGGSGCTSKTRKYNQKWGDLCTPSYSCNTFKGWNTKKDGSGSTITSTSPVTKNLTVYAQWEHVTPTITCTNNHTVQYAHANSVYSSDLMTGTCGGVYKISNKSSGDKCAFKSSSGSNAACLSYGFVNWSSDFTINAYCYYETGQANQGSSCTHSFLAKNCTSDGLCSETVTCSYNVAP